MLQMRKYKCNSMKVLLNKESKTSIYILKRFVYDLMQGLTNSLKSFETFMVSYMYIDVIMTVVYIYFKLLDNRSLIYLILMWWLVSLM